DGLLCGYAYYGKPVSLCAGKGKRRDYAYYRCCGSDAYRFGGQRVCTNLQLRTDRLDEAVWQGGEGVLRGPRGSAAARPPTGSVVSVCARTCSSARTGWTKLSGRRSSACCGTRGALRRSTSGGSGGGPAGTARPRLPPPDRA